MNATIFAILLIVSPQFVSGSATPEMASPEFWPASEDVVMTSGEIEEYNAALVAEGKLDLVDVYASDSVIDGKTVREAIESYSIPSDYGYLGRARATETAKSEILSLRNLSAVPDSVHVRYGVVTTAADLRSFPTDLTCTENGIVSGSLCFDDFQQSTLWLGEGVLVWHESADGEWLFVRAENYAGWVRASRIGLCSRDEMAAYTKSPEFSVVLEQKFTNVAGVYMPLMMGTRFARSGSSGKVLAPVRLADGRLGTVETVVDADMSDGYLQYSVAEVLRQAFRLLGTPYSWGNAGGYNDCSGTLLSVYYCFGIHLPRNSSSMRKMSRGNLGKEVDWTGVMPGSPVILPGHAMMFIGCVDGEPYILHAVNAIFHKEDGTARMRREQCSVTLVSSSSDIFRKTGLSFLDSFVNVIEIR
ncbi:MAG: SH3 domain-containing protein [Bacteroidales bacterium]|nr:SH3 domain-containing protein [Bacteroidales bacterium]